MTKRCKWCRKSNEEYVKYHDNEWGRETHDDDNLYELLVLEPFQAGLSWETILNRRDAFKRAFDGYDREKICSYGDEKICLFYAGFLLNCEGSTVADDTH